MKIDSDAAAYARRVGLNLEELTDSEREALDVEGAGEVSQRDVASAVSLFHGGPDGMMNADESRRLVEFLGAERGWSRHPVDADYLHQHVAERAGGLERAVAVSDASARERFLAARAALGVMPPPDSEQSTAALEAQRSAAQTALDSLPQRQATYRTAQTHVEQLGQSVQAGEKALNEKRRARAALKAAVGRDSAPALEELIAQREALTSQLEARGDTSGGVSNQRAIASLRQRVANIAALGVCRQDVDALQAQVLQARRALSAADAAVPARPEAELDARRAVATSSKQLEYRLALESYRSCEGNWRAAHGLLTRAQAVEQDALNAVLSPAFATLRNAELDSADHLAGAGRISKALAGPAAIRALVDAGKLNRKDIQLGLLDRRLSQMQGMMDAHTEALDRDAQSMVDLLADPLFQEALEREPESVRAEVVARMLGVLSKSQVGKAYFEKEVRPALEDKPGASVFWKGFVAVKGSTKATFKVLGALGGLIASQHDASSLLDSSLKTALGLSGEAGIRELQRGVLQYKSIRDALGEKPTAAQLAEAKEKFRAAMQGTTLVRLADSIDTVSDTLGAVSGAIAVAEAFRRPSIQSVIGAVKGTADVAQAGANFASRIVEEGGRWAAFSKAAGSLGSVATGVLADMDRRHSANQGDLGGAVGASVSETGAAVAANGLALDATGLGAAIGVPLNAIGGVMSIAGTAISWLYKDSDTDQWLRDNDLLMYSSHGSYATQQGD